MDAVVVRATGEWLACPAGLAAVAVLIALWVVAAVVTGLALADNLGRGRRR